MLHFGMIYAIGHTEGYRGSFEKAKAEGKPPPTKVGKGKVEVLNADGQVQLIDYPGGSVWRTREDAERWLREDGPKYEPPRTTDKFCVWGVDADWEKDTEPDPEHSFHNLLKDSPLIDLYA